MNDEQLIDYIAKIWFDNGGDADGIAFCWQRIADRVDDYEEKERDNAGE